MNECSDEVKRKAKRKTTKRRNDEAKRGEWGARNRSRWFVALPAYGSFSIGGICFHKGDCYRGKSLNLKRQEKRIEYN